MFTQLVVILMLLAIVFISLVAANIISISGLVIHRPMMWILLALTIIAGVLGK